MRRVGTVERIAQGVAVARAADDDPSVDRGDPPDVGDEVIDESLDVVGRVVAVFGPVDRPYVAVDPADVDPATLFDEVLYAR